MAVFPIKVIAQPHYEYDEESYIAISGFEGWQNYKNQKNQTLDFNPCSCVSLSKKLTGFNEPIGLARNWPRNSNFPAVGEVVILNESTSGHVAVITQVWADEFKVDETNWIPCKRSQRVIKNDDPDILGYYQ